MTDEQIREWLVKPKLELDEIPEWMEACMEELLELRHRIRLADLYLSQSEEPFYKGMKTLRGEP